MEGKEEKVFNVILVIGVILMIFVILQINSREGFNLGTESQVYSCSSDTDCMAANKDCCGCGGGGKMTAVNKNYIGYWNEKLFNSCKGTVNCPAATSRDMSCSSQARCIEGNCTLVVIV